jgi:hypothetical protein
MSQVGRHGNFAIVMITTLAYFAIQTGTVRIHLTDAHSRPIAGHEIWLDKTNSTKAVRPFGIQWYIPGGSFHGITDKAGNVSIPKVPLKKPMMVVVKFGPRFDPFVGENNPSGASLDVMKFEGAVYAGKKAHVILADDREISGKVTDAEGKPLAGIEVTLSDTGFGHMGGYPGTRLDLQKTDSQGNYRFTKLPNCYFSLFAFGPEGTAVQSRVGSGPTELISTSDFGTSASVLAKEPKATCDFKIIRTAKVTAIFKGTAAEFDGWTAWIYAGDNDLGGQQLDYSPTSTTITRETLPGPITIWVSRDLGNVWWVAKKLDVEPGEKRTVEISMAEVLKRRQRR